MSKTYWHELEFKHTCGTDGSILEICVSRDYSIAINGVCIMCAESFNVQLNLVEAMGNCAVADYLHDLNVKTEDWLDMPDKGMDN